MQLLDKHEVVGTNPRQSHGQVAYYALNNQVEACSELSPHGTCCLLLFNRDTPFVQVLPLHCTEVTDTVLDREEISDHGLSMLELIVVPSLRGMLFHDLLLRHVHQG